MPSEKMRYINRRMSAKSAVRTDIEMTPLKEEIDKVFNCPVYTCNDMMRYFIEKINGGTISDQAKQRLSAEIDKISRMEAYQDYGSPFCLSLWERR